ACWRSRSATTPATCSASTRTSGPSEQGRSLRRGYQEKRPCLRARCPDHDRTSGFRLRPDRELVAARLGEVEPAPSGKGKNRLYHFPAGRDDFIQRVLELLAVEN